jgi:hypothetical protein
VVDASEVRHLVAIMFSSDFAAILRKKYATKRKEPNGKTKT